MEEELRTLEYNPDREREELMQEAERGRKYKAAQEVLFEIFNEQRENIIRQLETQDFERDSDATGLVLYLRVMNIFVSLIQSRIDNGDLAEKELVKNGD